MDTEQVPQPMIVTENSTVNTNGGLDIPSFNSYAAHRTMRLPSAPSIMTRGDASNFSASEISSLQQTGRTERLPSAPSIMANTLEVPGHLPQGSTSANNTTKRVSNRKLRAYSFDDSIREFRPDKLYQTKDNRKRESYMVNGVNILNRDDVDSTTAINRLQKRREQHNRVERRRRDLINTSIEELSEIVPLAQLEGVKFARGNVLRLTIDYIKELQQEIQSLKLENENLRNSSSAQIPRLDPTKRPPTIVINQPGNLPVNTTFPSPSSAGWESEIRTPTDGQDFTSIGSNHSSQLISPVTSSPFPSPFHSPSHSPFHSPIQHPSSPINENPFSLPHPALPEITLTTASSLASSPVPMHGSVPSSPGSTSPTSPLPLQLSSWQPFSNSSRNS